VLGGEESRELAIWKDADGNGVSEAGDMLRVSHWGIVAIACAHEIEAESHLYVASSARGVTFGDGATRPTYAVLLQKKD
jgi:hypothetical protein